MKKRFFAIFGFLLLSGAVFEQMAVLHSKIFGAAVFVLSLGILGSIWKRIYTNILSVEEKIVVTLLSYATPVFLFGLLSGIATTWYVPNAFLLVLSFFLTSIISVEIFFRVQKKQEDLFDIYNFEFPPMSPPGMLPAIYLFLATFTFLGIAVPATTSLQSPWQYLPSFFLYLFFLLTFILGYLIFSLKRTSFLLFLLVIHSLLLHSYLPLSHALPWGGDVWRNIGLEEKFLEEQPLLPVLFGPEVKWRDFGAFSLPEALTIPNKYVYGHFWGESVFLVRFFNADILTFNKFFVPLLWGLLMPLLAYGIGRKLFPSEKQALFFSFITFLPFPLQALGGLTVAVSWGMIFFTFLLFLWLEYIQTKNTSVRNLALFFGALSVFGYTLFFVLFLVMVMLTLLLQKIGNTSLRNSVWGVASVVLMGIFPVLELISKTSHFPQTLSLFHNLKQFLGQWSGWFYVTLIRDHDIASGNIIFNHTPLYSFVKNIFTFQRVHLMVLMLILFLCILNALLSNIREKKLEWKIMTSMFVVTFFGYVLSWYVLEGEHSFARRLDPVLSFTLVLLAVHGFFLFVKKYKRFSGQKWAVVVGIFFLSWSITTVYASGPDLHVVSTDEYQVATVVAPQVQGNACILADTWLLLAVEGVSNAQIVGGGFPIDPSFGQTERVKLYQSLLEGSVATLGEQAHSLTGASECFVVVPKNTKNLAKIREKFGKPEFQNATLLVWKIGLKNNPE